MQLFLDTANLEQIEEATRLGVISGVTTNPTLIAKEGASLTERIEQITTIVDGSVSAEVISETSEGMIREGRQLAKISPQVTVKLPMTRDGLTACHTLVKEGISTNVTLIFSVNQALLAARAGATYVSPFVGRLDDIGQMGMQLVREIRQMFDLHGLPTKIIAASIRHTDHVTRAALAGAHIATLPLAILNQMIEHPLTDKGIQQFLADWNDKERTNDD